MKRTVKIFGIATVLAVLLAVSIGGVVSAAGGGLTKNQYKNSGECPCIDCPCEECNLYQYNYGELAENNENMNQYAKNHANRHVYTYNKPD